MSHFYHANEHQHSETREQNLLSRLADFITYAKNNSPYYQAILANIDATNITTRSQLATLPITRKSDLLDIQKQQPPLGGLASKSGHINRIFQSPGPIYDPENCQQDWWRMGQAFHAAGFRAGELVQNCLSYHLTPGGFILDSGARACGCVVIPAGPGQTDQQLDVIEDLHPQGYCGTPSFLKILLDKAQATKRDVSSLKKALVTGEALSHELRESFKQQGINTLQTYASADVGLIGYETIADDGLIIAEDLIVEIVRPGSLTPVADGEIGEVVITSFNTDYPLIRFATGDLSAIKPGQSACGRTNMRIQGWLGRADQTTKIKGMFVHPQQIERIRLSVKGIKKMRLVVKLQDHQDKMQLLCEYDQDQSELTKLELTGVLLDNLKQYTKLNGSVELVELGSLADDGKVIDDQRVIG
ncbi:MULTISPECIES: phenylacetate--CoA ligase family protein [unclassified Pseudoalteromonas]|uniref:phenylacetate--CoA ligase family protein n=1 Tax=unclassified Pseudoalteromonas TaxID=194690 RepID=UPI00160289D2|nr:AMP-binding protein [Pseudoalteromonas sp. SG41-5]MBB1466997.1 AMP-binding protein [Pseudoalteromonas sp. SG41-5]